MSYSWLEFHGAVTHFPVALIIVGFAFEAGALAFRKQEWRAVSFWCLLVGVVGAAASVLSGLKAFGAMYGHGTPPALVLNHRMAAYWTTGCALALLVWRIATRDALSGASRTAAAVVLAAAAVLVSVTGFLGGQIVFGGGQPQASAPPAKPIARSSSPAPAASAQMVSMGMRLYAAQGCSDCHRIDGHGGQDGPDLSHEGSRQPDPAWQIAHLVNPSKMKPGSGMPAYNTLSQQQLAALAAFLVSRT